MYQARAPFVSVHRRKFFVLKHRAVSVLSIGFRS